MDRHVWIFPPADLSNEWELANCHRRQFAGALRPVVGRPEYPVLARVAAGGMGIVYYGFHPGFEIDVAIKILPRHLLEHRPDLGRRFLREGRLAARLPSSDHLVRVYDVGFDAGQDARRGLHYLVMEYVHGTTAGKWLAAGGEHGPRGVAEDLALDVCIAAATGLCVFHRQGAIHRDVKPDNILIPSAGSTLLCTGAKLSDLGLARPDGGAEHVDEHLTGTGLATMGTPGFAAPEQLHDAAGVKKPADVFSFGATIYALLAGRSPFATGRGALETILANRKAVYAPVRTVRPDVSEATAALIDVCLRLDPTARYPDAFALVDALQLCRRALTGGTSSAHEVTAQVRQFAAHSEVGAAVRSDPGSGSAGSSVAGSTSIRIEDGAPGAQVRLRRRGNAPLTYALALDGEGRFAREHVEPGTYDVTASRAGWHPLTGEVEIRGGDSNVVRLKMHECDGRLTVDTDPPGAEARVDDVRIGETPLHALAVAAGPHTLALHLAGHEPVTVTFVVRGDEERNLGRIVLPALGTLDLTGCDDDVTFELDGRPVSGRVELHPGEYHLTAAREGHEPQEVAVRVVARGKVAPSLGPWLRQSWTLISDLARWDATTDDDRRRVARAIAHRVPGFELRAMETFESGGARHEVAVLVHRPTGVEFSLVPGHEFLMGSHPDEPSRRADERPHPVRVGPFLMARTPVTQAVFEKVVGRNPSSFQGPSLPVDHVTWQDASDFCRRAGLDLPTEAQWEHACRAGTGTPWATGDDPAHLAASAWFAGNAADGPRPVGSREPNAFGLHDMHGNVWEWCADAYSEYPFDRVEEMTPAACAAAGVGEDAPRYRVFRGGAWCDPPAELRAARRFASRPDHRGFDLGFRPVCALSHGLFTATATPLPGGTPAPSPLPPARGAARAPGTAAPAPTTSAPGAPRTWIPSILLDLARWDAATADERERAARAVATRHPDFVLSSMTSFEAGGARHEVAVLSHSPTGLEFVLAPGAAATAPVDPSDPSAHPTGPVSAAVPPFLVARTPTTQAAWRRVTGAAAPGSKGDAYPVEQVTWDEASSFCTRAGLVLPTETQWEHACRAGVAAPWCSGPDESLVERFAWIATNSGQSTHPVGGKLPNAFGLFDVHGNVWEWCRERTADAAARPASAAGRPAGCPVRGGAWTSVPQQARSTSRLVYPLAVRMQTLGFRAIRELDP